MRLFIVGAVLVFVMVFSVQARAECDMERTFTKKCSMCHGKAGVGTSMAPALSGTEFIRSDAELIKETFLNGRSKKAKKYKKFVTPMPKYNFTDEEADCLVEYLKGL
ncbi:MAG: cytochrome c [Deltaproteobacteria bacterium]|nr:cytochrome c [Deltaproteobacteria bacterium]